MCGLPAVVYCVVLTKTAIVTLAMGLVRNVIKLQTLIHKCRIIMLPTVMLGGVTGHCHHGRAVTVRIRYTHKGINLLRYRTTNVLICFDGAEQDWNIDVQMLICGHKMYLFVVVNYIV